jgi:5-(carboxyamino)imidazole ribonucleotide synthase
VIKPFDKRIGIIGGGQLGKMLIESAAGWNLNYVILETDEHAPAVRYASGFIKGSLTDSAKIMELSAQADVITYEIEHLDAHTLFEIEQTGVLVIPSAGILKIIQDKGLQKLFYEKHGLPTVPFILADNEKKIENLNSLRSHRIVIKNCKEGYDGKGVEIMDKQAFVQNGMKLPFTGPCIIEEFVTNALEYSVIVARNRTGDVKVYPPVEMVFDDEANLVEYLFAPARLTPEQEEYARHISLEAIDRLEGIGIFAVEIIGDEVGNLFINEIAPRPHNSGHHTIEACITSQYEQLNRILLGLPLGETDLLQPAVMVNLLGPPGFEGPYSIEGTEEAFKIPGFHLHLYNKQISKHKRKMGHYTVIAPTIDEALDHAMKIKDSLHFAPLNLIPESLIK